MDKFFENRKLRPNTARSYRDLIRRCLGDWLDRPVTSITRDMVQARHLELTKTTKQGTSGETQANMAMRVLKTMLNFAANNYESADGKPIITINPVSRLSQNRCWHSQSGRKVIIAESQLAKWYRGVISLRQTVLRDYLLLMLLTGFRRYEAASLRWSDVDFATKLIRIRSEVAKNKKEYSLPISSFLLALLSQRYATRTDEEYVFPSRKGKGHIRDPKYAVSAVVKNSGCSFVPQDLRRTYISMAARLGIPNNIIKRLVNHTTLSDVTDRYIVFEPEVLR